MFKKGYQIFDSFIEPSTLDVFYEAIDKNPVTCYGNKNFFKVNDPYLVCPDIIDIALSNDIKKIATMFLGSQWGLGTCNLRRSVLTNQVDRSTTLFHRDNNSRNFIKMFFYLNDVDINGGPFTYVEGSHIDRRESGWSPGSRWTDEIIVSLYGNDRIKHLTANKGDLIVANTTGFHKGLKCKERERRMLTLNFTTEVEKFGKFKMSRHKYEDLSEEDKFRCRFTEPI